MHFTIAAPDHPLDADAVLILDVLDREDADPEAVLDACRARAEKYDRDAKGGRT